MSVDPNQLLVDLGGARDQGARPTCLSFSLSEIHRAAIALGELLSPESLHRQAAARASKRFSEGLALHEATDSLSTDGQTTEANWPYNADSALNAGSAFHRATAASAPFDQKFIVAALRSSQPLGLIMDVDLTFFSHVSTAALALTTGAQIQGRHAVVICGLRVSTGGVDYLIKNSWGIDWGMNGYAWLTHEHISARSPLLVWI